MINPATGNEQELQQPVAPRYGRGRRMRNGFYKRGISGYDPEYPDMRGAFMARGPGNCPKYIKLCRNVPILFKDYILLRSIILFNLGFNIKKEAQPPIEIVDLYEMFCHLLNIIPAENDGVWDRIKGLLKNSSPMNKPSSVVVLVLSLCALIWTNTI